MTILEQLQAKNQLDRFAKDAFSEVTTGEFPGRLIFPRRPLLDRVIVREIPLKEYYQQPEGITVDLDNSHIRERSDRGEVVAISMKVGDGGEVRVGDVVTYDETVMCVPIYLNPADKNKPDLPKYWLIRVPDITSVVNDGQINPAEKWMKYAKDLEQHAPEPLKSTLPDLRAYFEIPPNA